MVNINLYFIDWFCYSLIILIISNPRESPTASEKPSVLFEILKILMNLTQIEMNIFCWNFSHIFYLKMLRTECVGFLFCAWLHLNLFETPITLMAPTHSQKHSFINNLVSKLKETKTNKQKKAHTVL